ncbi:NADH-quinone oxidoreductase subunit G [Acidipropionibacterium jensenii]|uniref:NADH-quinone oxidoreductase subunit G n=1 Tax=Acidipropionibacterium jensenii TaxID=1749 RepID=UPI000BC2F441|nr:NADH-quinone oxidoreductase subunit G [Acidipropionibacterium jensenii]AZZ42789.1 NADH-quinone oxidoreductase subunit G [Acidipropionibacterium jensenii]
MSVDTKSDSAEVARPDLVTLTIDGRTVSVPKGTLIIRAAEQIGTAIPRFCDHPLLDPAGACRQCLVEIPDAGNGRGFPKPQPSCTMPVAEGMVVRTQVSSELARNAQEGMLELLLINHPLDCPICDKGGECPLQNQAIADGRGESRYKGVKRTYPKPISISAQILLDRERCVLCQRCTRFSDQISGDPFINLQERGAASQIGDYVKDGYDSYFSGNVIQICPVGALTSKDYRFHSRPFDLVSTRTTCEHCAAGCELRTDHRQYRVKRRLAGDLPEVNEEWNCDKGRFGFRYGHQDDRITRPLVRRDGVLQPASWAEALDAAVAGLRAAGHRVGVLTGGRLTVEANLAWSKFARLVLGTNNIDFRSRVSSAEEADFLASQVAGRDLAESVSYRDLERAGRVVLVDLEPEDEAPIIFLRLRKAWRARKLPVTVIGSHLTRGSLKMGATLEPCLPGNEDAALVRLVEGGAVDGHTIVLVGERAAASPGALTAVVDAVRVSGARLAWVPRRAGEVGAVEAGCLPGLLPGGRPVTDPVARVEMGAIWSARTLPATIGLDAQQMLAAVLQPQGEELEAEPAIGALMVSGVQPRDFADPSEVREALEKVGFLVSLEQRASEVTERADVVLPVCLLEETSGTFLDWEHRPGRVRVVNTQAATPMNEIRVLAALADAMGSDLGMRTVVEAHQSWAETGAWAGRRPALGETADGPEATAAPARRPHAPGSSPAAVLDSWQQLLDRSAGLDGATDLQASARPAVVRVCPAAADRLGAGEGTPVTVSAASGSVTLPLAVDTTMIDGAVWVPWSGPVGPRSGEPPIHETLGVLPGSPVELSVASSSITTQGGAE